MKKKRWHQLMKSGLKRWGKVERRQEEVSEERI